MPRNSPVESAAPTARSRGCRAQTRRALAQRRGVARRALLHDVATACDTEFMIDDDALRAELESTWRREIPLAAAMALTVIDCRGATLTARAPLAPNRNLHGTAFAGSLFSLCVLTGWGAVWLALRRHALAGLIVVADSRIRYRKAVTGDIVCHCTAEAQAVEALAAEVAAGGRGRLQLTCTIDVADRRAVSFDGTYVVHAEHR
jgi:thioesterase domain-containing protein